MPIKFKKPKPAKAIEDHAPQLPQPVLKYKDQPDLSLKYHLHRHAPKETTARHHNVVHASDLDPPRNWCPREPALLTQHNRKRPGGFLSTAQRVTHAFGHSGADIVISMIPDDMVWGNWVCLGCGHIQELQYRPKFCPNCSAKKRALRYKEVLLRDPVTGIVGSPDILVDFFRNGQKWIVELKTEGEEGFKKRKAAEFEHEWRTNLYLWLAEQTSWTKQKGVQTHEGRVMYICKSGYAQDDDLVKWKVKDWKKSPFKEYKVPGQFSFHENARKAVWAYRAWREAWDAGKPLDSLPDRCEACTHSTCARAEACSVKEECWG